MSTQNEIRTISHYEVKQRGNKPPLLYFTLQGEVQLGGAAPQARYRVLNALAIAACDKTAETLTLVVLVQDGNNEVPVLVHTSFGQWKAIDEAAQENGLNPWLFTATPNTSSAQQTRMTATTTRARLHVLSIDRSTGLGDYPEFLRKPSRTLWEALVTGVGEPEQDLFLPGCDERFIAAQITCKGKEGAKDVVMVVIMPEKKYQAVFLEVQNTFATTTSSGQQQAPERPPMWSKAASGSLLPGVGPKTPLQRPSGAQMRAPSSPGRIPSLPGMISSPPAPRQAMPPIAEDDDDGPTVGTGTGNHRPVPPVPSQAPRAVTPPPPRTARGTGGAGGVGGSVPPPLPRTTPAPAASQPDPRDEAMDRMARELEELKRTLNGLTSPGTVSAPVHETPSLSLTPPAPPIPGNGSGQINPVMALVIAALVGVGMFWIGTHTYAEEPSPVSVPVTTNAAPPAPPTVPTVPPSAPAAVPPTAGSSPAVTGH